MKLSERRRCFWEGGVSQIHGSFQLLFAQGECCGGEKVELQRYGYLDYVERPASADRVLRFFRVYVESVCEI